MEQRALYVNTAGSEMSSSYGLKGTNWEHSEGRKLQITFLGRQRQMENITLTGMEEQNVWGKTVTKRRQKQQVHRCQLFKHCWKTTVKLEAAELASVANCGRTLRCKTAGCPQLPASAVSLPGLQTELDYAMVLYLHTALVITVLHANGADKEIKPLNNHVQPDESCTEQETMMMAREPWLQQPAVVSAGPRLQTPKSVSSQPAVQGAAMDVAISLEHICTKGFGIWQHKNNASNICPGRAAILGTVPNCIQTIEEFHFASDCTMLLGLQVLKITDCHYNPRAFTRFFSVGISRRAEIPDFHKASCGLVQKVRGKDKK
ncbi:hypothetical protein Anapl_15062 [Anas platyrhynchos]|uniref:Uncharacterized protein n=1 Tax=Anas platyrhynchos TaxID=8839 RepID=R0JIJ5_ANAPL|nr:hypothetical protein Anapl_15062 [Anas platyrhynchos]